MARKGGPAARSCISARVGAGKELAVGLGAEKARALWNRQPETCWATVVSRWLSGKVVPAMRTPDLWGDLT